MQDTQRLGAEKVEQSLREVKVVESASHALVDNLGLTSLATDGDGYRLEAMCTSIELLCVESDNKIAGLVRFSASTRASLVKGKICACATPEYRQPCLFAFADINSSMVPLGYMVLC